MNDEILIWGSGAIGASLGAAFLRAGEKVLFVDRVEAHVRALATRGLRIEGPIFEGTFEARAVLPQDLHGTFRRVFLCVKSHHTIEAMLMLAPFVADDGYVVSAQNGLNERDIIRQIGAVRCIGCFVNFGADYIEPGVVQYSGRGAVVVGEVDGSVGPRIRALHDLMVQFDPQAILTTNIWGYLWGKMMYGALLYASALTDAGIAPLFDMVEHRSVLAALAREVGRVAAAEHIVLEGFDGFAPEAFSPGASDARVARSFDLMGAHNRRSTKIHSGIWRDLAIRERPTEVDAQLGPIVEIGAIRDVDVPLTARLIRMIHEIEGGRRMRSVDNLAELALLSHGGQG